jgi:HK97 family phage prohead protease
MREHKAFNFDYKANLENGTFEGYASIFGNIDSYKDIVTKGAFTKTIQENKNRIKILWQHDLYEPIGKPLEIKEDNTGLYVKGKISQTEMGQKALTLMRDGVLSEMSIGYDTIKEEYDKVSNIRYLKEVKLWEFSVVTFGANDKAKINNVKNKNINDIYTIIHELKVGRTLSNATRSKIQDIIDALIILLEDEMEDENEFMEPLEIDGCTPKPRKNLEIDPNQIQSILKQIKQYKGV